MNTTVKTTCALLAALLLLSSCGKSDPAAPHAPQESQASAARTNAAQTQEAAPAGETDDLLPFTYKVPLKEIYFDYPALHFMEAGYTRICWEADKKYIAFSCNEKATVSSTTDAYEVIVDDILRATDSHFPTHGTYEFTTELVEINGTEMCRFEGTVDAGLINSTLTYTYGYAFLMNGYACGILGLVMDENQPQEEIDSVRMYADAMAERVRTEK